MAHNCSACGQLCHCGGDIDDIPFSGTKEEYLCEHCPELDELEWSDPEDAFVCRTCGVDTDREFSWCSQCTSDRKSES
jgi:hypothetical protein